jgi:hypothetical protein
MASRIAIVSASVGAGHDGAAREVARQLRDIGHDVGVSDFMDLVGARTGRALRAGHGAQLRLVGRGRCRPVRRRDRRVPGWRPSPPSAGATRPCAGAWRARASARHSAGSTIWQLWSPPAMSWYRTPAAQLAGGARRRGAGAQLPLPSRPRHDERRGVGSSRPGALGAAPGESAALLSSELAGPRRTAQHAAARNQASQPPVEHMLADIVGAPATTVPVGGGAAPAVVAR